MENENINSNTKLNTKETINKCELNTINNKLNNNNTLHQNHILSQNQKLENIIITNYDELQLQNTELFYELSDKLNAKLNLENAQLLFRRFRSFRKYNFIDYNYNYYKSFNVNKFMHDTPNKYKYK